MGQSHPNFPSFLVLISILTLGAGTVGARPPGDVPPGLANGTRAEQIQQRLERLRSAIEVHRRHHHDLIGRSGVVATGVGLGPDGEPVIKVYTDRLREWGIPESLDGIRVRSQVSGRIYALRGSAPTCDEVTEPPVFATDGVCTTYERWPLPVPIGVSVGHPDISAGSIGARVTDGANVFILSNNHVLANINQASLGDPALQPGSFDGGTPDDAIASLSAFEPLRFCECTSWWWFWCLAETCPSNSIDAAIAQSTPAELGVSTPMGEHDSPEGYGIPSANLHPAYGDPGTIGDEDLAALLDTQVQKFGRTTDLTIGSIDTVSATVDVCYDSGCVNRARMSNQIIISPGSFSEGGDSGSLIVDMDQQPVGLLFAGSSTSTIANRIDLVLNRFGVTIDDGGDVAPIDDIAVTDISLPPNPVVNEPAVIAVTVRNVGNQDISEAITVVLSAQPEGGILSEIGRQTIDSGLAVGATTDLSFTWTPTIAGTHTLQAEQIYADRDDDGNDTATGTVTVLTETVTGPVLTLWSGQAHTNEWFTVPLTHNYGEDMVVVCTPSYDNTSTGPAIARVRNARETSFEVGLARPWYGALDIEHFSTEVHCMVIREGVYAAGEHGVTMEAVKLENFATIDSAGSWYGEQQLYQQAYTNPVVVGQVHSPDTGTPPSHCPAARGNICDPDWSVFWSHGTSASAPPSSGALYVGRHSGEDPNGRSPETLMYVVIEAGSGTIGDRAYVAGLGADSVRGITNNPPYVYSHGLTDGNTAIASQAAMDGGNGGWVVLYGPDPVTADSLRLAIDEDWYLDSERNHTTEQVGYIVFE